MWLHLKENEILKFKNQCPGLTKSYVQGILMVQKTKLLCYTVRLVKETKEKLSI